MASLEPTSNDVLLGKSSKAFRHEGNIAFRRTVLERFGRYKKHMRRTWKSDLVDEILDEIRSKGGRFLSPSDEEAEQWKEISLKDARVKVSHALRDARTARLCRTRAQRRNVVLRQRSAAGCRRLLFRACCRGIELITQSMRRTKVGTAAGS